MKDDEFIRRIRKMYEKWKPQVTDPSTLVCVYFMIRDRLELEFRKKKKKNRPNLSQGDS